MERLRSVDEAEEGYLRALAADPEHAQSLTGLANLLSDVRGDHKSAISYFERAIVASKRDLDDADKPLTVARRQCEEGARNTAVHMTGSCSEAIRRKYQIDTRQ